MCNFIIYQKHVNTFMTKVPMTLQGASQLRAALDRLKREDRPRIIKAIAEATQLGDLKENAEYHAAKEQQGLIEARIRDIESKLAHSNIIDIAKINIKDRIVFGATAHLINLATEEKSTYQIVGNDEADIKNNKMSINSPLARALIGKKIGDVADVTTPAGLVRYSIIKIEYI
jgi:transcription elongation factor GreA